MVYRLLIWDLDGTLLDTLEDLASSMNRVLQRMGFPIHPAREYRYFVGDGMEVLARRVLPEDRQTERDIQLCKKAMLQEYSTSWKEKTKPYPGIMDLLEDLTASGVQMAVFSNKPHSFTTQMVEYFFPGDLFTPVLGVGGEIPKKPNPFGVQKILHRLQVRPEEAIFIGDTRTDMETAVNAGLCPIGVLWGFREEKELLEFGAYSLLQHPRGLLPLLKGGESHAHL